MIDQAILNRIRASVCAIGYPEVDPDLACGDAEEGDQMAPIPVKVCGTGFLVRETTVLTNHHVVEALSKSKVPHEQWLLSFVYPREGGWQMCCRRNLRGSYFSNPDLDIAMFEFTRGTSKEFEQCQPVTLGELAAITVSQQVAMCGYLYGTALLEVKALNLYRYGPVVHQGYISAIAPFDSTPSRGIVNFLTDIRSGRGMSGSPVFLPQEGTVVGIHYAGTNDKVGFAIPIDTKRVSEWLAVHDQTLEKKAVAVWGTDSGDIVSVEKI